MENLTRIEKFRNCAHKGFRRCPHYDNPIMQQAITPDIPQGSTPIDIHFPSPEDEERAAELCENCTDFRRL